MTKVKVVVEDKPMYSIAFKRLADDDDTDEEDIVELLATMASFAEGWIVPDRIEITVSGGGFLVAEVASADAIPLEVARATGGDSPGISISWRTSHAKLPDEVEPMESTMRAFSFSGSTDHGNMRIKVGIYWSAWLQFPQMLNDAIGRVLDRETGWAQSDLNQVNHWLGRDS